MWGYVYWPWWLAVVSVAFLGPEVFALATNVKSTLSYYCWHELHMDIALSPDVHGMAWWNSLLAWLLFTVVITAHIWWRQPL